jgi:hypothetical protein
VNENEISKVIVESAIEVHRELGGPGLIERTEVGLGDQFRRAICKEWDSPSGKWSLTLRLSCFAPLR